MIFAVRLTAQHLAAPYPSAAKEPRSGALQFSRGLAGVLAKTGHLTVGHIAQAKWRRMVGLPRLWRRERLARTILPGARSCGLSQREEVDPGANEQTEQYDQSDQCNAPLSPHIP